MIECWFVYMFTKRHDLMCLFDDDLRHVGSPIEQFIKVSTMPIELTMRSDAVIYDIEKLNIKFIVVKNLWFIAAPYKTKFFTL